MYKFHWIFLVFIASLIASNLASPTHKPTKSEQSHQPTSNSNQNTNSFRPISGNSNHGEHKSMTHKEGESDGQSKGNDGYAKGQVFEYSYSTFHQDPQSRDILSPMSDEKQETVLANGSDNFADHEMARQTLPRFFSYPSMGGMSDNSTDPSASIKQFEEAFKAEAAASGTSENPIVANFQPALGEVTAASYFSYSPPSVPGFMKMGFSGSDIDDGDMDDESLDGGDLDFKSSNSPKQMERSSEYKDKDSEGGEEDPKVKMVQVLMGRKNEKGKPWGTKTTLVYRDPKDANNYMQVTEVKMSVKSNKNGPESGGDEVSKVSKSSFHGSSYANQPTLGGYGGDFFEPNEPPEPSF